MILYILINSILIILVASYVRTYSTRVSYYHSVILNEITRVCFLTTRQRVSL